MWIYVPAVLLLYFSVSNSFTLANIAVCKTTVLRFFIAERRFRPGVRVLASFHNQDGGNLSTKIGILSTYHVEKSTHGCDKGALFIGLVFDAYIHGTGSFRLIDGLRRG